MTAALPPVADRDTWAAALAVALYLPVQNYILMTLWVFALPHPKTEYMS